MNLNKKYISNFHLIIDLNYFLWEPCSVRGSQFHDTMPALWLKIYTYIILKQFFFCSSNKNLQCINGTVTVFVLNFQEVKHLYAEFLSWKRIAKVWFFKARSWIWDVSKMDFELFARPRVFLCTHWWNNIIIVSSPLEKTTIVSFLAVFYFILRTDSIQIDARL